MTQQNIGKLIRSRRTIHEFKRGQKPDITLVKEAISIACWAPNHYLSEPWHFYLLGDDTKQAICELNREILLVAKGKNVAEDKYQNWMEKPGWLVMTCDKTDDKLRFIEDYAACCCVIQNMMLYLWENKVGMKWSTSALIHDPRFYEIIWVNSEMEDIIGLFWYGYPAEIPQTTRKSIEQFLTELP